MGTKVTLRRYTMFYIQRLKKSTWNLVAIKISLGMKLVYFTCSHINSISIAATINTPSHSTRSFIIQYPSFYAN